VPQRTFMWHSRPRLCADMHPVYFIDSGGHLIFDDPVEELRAERVEQVMPLLERAAAAVNSGLYAAGFIAYEAAPAFDPALVMHPPLDAFPLAHFTLYRSMRREPLPPPAAAPGPYPQWRAALDEKTYGRAVQWIREKIAAGDTYQVNYTFNLHADFAGDAHAWLRHFWPRQRAAYAGLYQAGEFSILSLSPELFFELDGQRLITCPMKGTRRRGRWPAEDDALAAELHSSAKDRAENAMIVDLLRNDLGRVSATGSVRVTHPFAIERYPTVWQMTSTVEASTQADVPHILAALFPCGSVTGAPKVRTMQLIAEAEREPRGVYCGTLGWWGPGRRAVFNVAIRTLCIDHTGGRATYGIGGGITWDSDPAAEWRECAAKAAVIMPRPIFALLESMRYEGTVFLMEEHLRRMSCSAEYFGYPFDASAARQKIELCAAGLPSGAHKIRVLLDAAGGITVESAPLPPTKTFRIALAAAPIDPADVFLYHKTTHRAVYENALRDRPDCDDVVLWNPAGELTETTIANLCLKIDGRWLTPPVRCGLLPGTLRQHLLECGEIHEAVLTRADLARAEQIALINSVRGWIAAVVCE